MTRHSDSKRSYDNEGPLRVVGHIWEANEAGTWSRYLVRRHEGSGRSIPEPLHHVDASSEFCLACLSNDVQVVFEPGPPGRKVRHCGGCGVQYWLLAE